MSLPLLLAVTLGLVWLLSLGTAQVLLVDATREAARALARGDSQDDALDRARQVAPSGTQLTVTGDGGEVTVTGRVRVDGTAGLLEVMPSVEVTAEATAVREAPP
jgi:hypothetical protein